MAGRGLKAVLREVSGGEEMRAANLGAWLDNRIDRRVEHGIDAAVRAIVESQRAEINRIRAAVAAEIAREQQHGTRTP